jgi:hypothetical protein
LRRIAVDAAMSRLPTKDRSFGPPKTTGSKIELEEYETSFDIRKTGDVYE